MTGPLIDVEALGAALDEPQPPLLLDVRWRLGGPPGRDGYLAGHLPGAVWTDLDADLAGPPGAGWGSPTAATTAEPGDFTARPGGMPVLDADEAARVATDGLLLDARAPERFRGEVEPVDPVAGHLPGARSAPATGNVGTDGRFLDPATLRRRFDPLGAIEAASVGAYCGSGVTAAHTVLALELAGFPAALYAGSWSEWVTDPSRPVATGAD